MAQVFPRLGSRGVTCAQRDPVLRCRAGSPKSVPSNAGPSLARGLACCGRWVDKLSSRALGQVDRGGTRGRLAEPRL